MRTSRRHLFGIALGACGALGGAACGQNEQPPPGSFTFPKVRDGHQYYLSEEERQRLQDKYAKGAGAG